MSAARSGGILAAALLLAWMGSGVPVQAEEKHDSVEGVVTGKGKDWLEVKADGETKGTRYLAPWIQAEKRHNAWPIGHIVVGHRVKLVWQKGESNRVLISIEVVSAGVVTGKGVDWLEIKADGETEGTAYTGLWNKAMKRLDHEAINPIVVGNKVKFVWVRGETHRVLISIEVAAAEAKKAPEEKKDK